MSKWGRGRRGHDHMVAGLITTYAISVYHHCEFEPCSVEVNLIQQYVIKLLSDLQQVGGFLWFPPSIKLTVILLKLESHIKHHKPKPIWGQMKNERAIVILSGSKMTCCKCVSSLEQNLSSDGSFFYLHPYFHISRKFNALLSDI
jgi:hypothetical protein